MIALPDWKNPRLYLEAGSSERVWKDSSFYPAFRYRASAYRYWLRLKAVFAPPRARLARPPGSSLQEFVKEAIPEVGSVAALVSRSDASRAMTVQLRTPSGRVCGYLKYARQRNALERLRHEAKILASLPKGLGPEVLTLGPFGGGEALLSQALPGKPASIKVPPARRVSDFLDAFPQSGESSIEDHPWAVGLAQDGDLRVERWLEALSDRASWPVVLQHGDYAPWNVLVDRGGLRAVDWEYGDLEGLCFVDLAHYLLQTLALVYRWRPLDAARYTTGYLDNLKGPKKGASLTRKEVDALVRLAVYAAYRRSEADGEPSETRLQSWRASILDAPRLQ